MKTRIKQRNKTIPADLLKLQQQFIHWRQTRPGKGRIPLVLFNEAAKLSLKYGLAFVCKQTGLSYMDTKARMQKIASLAKESIEVENRFIELAPLEPKQVLAPEIKPVQVYCELEGLKIFLSAPQAHDWENLIFGVLCATRSVQAAA